MHPNLPIGHYQNGVHGAMTATSGSLAAAGSGTGVLPREVLAAVNYQRTREMTIDELLLENRVVFLIGEINHASAARVIMQMLYLENQKKGQD
ncbi:MAG: ATP-dependent Clp protease proteolytic subunit, partial [Phycisphaerales bacterium]